MNSNEPRIDKRLREFLVLEKRYETILVSLARRIKMLVIHHVPQEDLDLEIEHLDDAIISLKNLVLKKQLPLSSKENIKAIASVVDDLEHIKEAVHFVLQHPSERTFYLLERAVEEFEMHEGQKEKLAV